RGAAAWCRLLPGPRRGRHRRRPSRLPASVGGRGGGRRRGRGGRTGVLESLKSLLNLEALGWRGLLDIMLVAALVYGVITLLRRTRGAPVAIGILLYVLIWRFALALD